MEAFWQKIAEILSLSKLEKRWRKVAKALAIVVVFWTTYMLILPAITMEMDTYCGFDEHIHEESCYVIESTPICGYESVLVAENEGLTSNTEEPSAEELTAEESTAEESTYEAADPPEEIHTHTSACYLNNKTLICTVDEHTHSEICFDAELAEKYGVDFMEDSSSDDYDIAPLAETDVGTRVNFASLDGSGKTYYIIYAVFTRNDGSKEYYAIDGDGKAVPVTVNGNVVTSAQTGNNLYWNFTKQSNGTNVYRIINLGTGRCFHVFHNGDNDNGVTTKNSYDATLLTSGSGDNQYFSVFCNNEDYAELAVSNSGAVYRHTFAAESSAKFYLAELFVPKDTYYVWFDGTCGGIMSLYDSDNTRQNVPGSNSTITLPTTWKSPSKYDYVLNGWYDIKNHKYYKPGEKVKITKNTVFYADWIAKTYDIGQFNENVVDSLDTNSFITTNMFDYSAIFNMQAVEHTGSVSASGHSEVWSVVQNANVPYNNAPSLGFIFRDWDREKEDISYPQNLERLNNSQSKEITSQIIDYVRDMSGRNIIDILFHPETEVIGKTHVGEANYLYQFMDQDSPNYDGIHNGYYYYDATKNAASYNQTEKRFYIYNYLERTSDSYKDGDKNSVDATSGKFSDFLPFNSPYANNSNGKIISDYKDANEKTGNYQYDAKYDGQESLAQNAGTNYWFGMKSEIKFYLPNDVGEDGVDGYGNYGNISTHGEHMNFQFHGDDDMWVFIDDVLVMDVGGLHGITTGKIDFSTGAVTTDDAKNNSLETTSKSYNLNLLFKDGLREGDHTLTIYYMERGGSQSNCAIYFNISPRYGMEITKKDALSNALLNGAEFTVYTDKSCSNKAQLWKSEQEYQQNGQVMSTFTAENGVASFWGISPGKVYYIKETKPPGGYPTTDDIIRVAMNNLGGTVCTIDSLTGDDNNHTDGFDIRESLSDEEERMLYIVLTNQVEKIEETASTNIRVTKSWSEGSQDIPQNITVYLTANGKIMEETATLSEANGWTYTWTGLPQKDESNNEIIYGVQEVQVPGYTGQITVSDFDDSKKWFKTDALRDRDTFLLVDKSTGKALSVSRNSLTWVDRSAAESNVSAQWMAIADGMGFYLENGNGKRLVLQLDSNKNPTKFIVDENSLRTLYFYDSKLFAQQNNVYYYFASDTTASSTGGLEFELYKKSTVNLSGKLHSITNKPIPQENETFVKVTKVWSDGDTAHMNDSITVRLYADGKDSGRVLKLNSSNNWTGTFDGLPYSDEESNIPIDYTVIEETFPGYIPEHSIEIVLPWVSADDGLKAGEIYRFTSNGYALSSNASSTVVSAKDNPKDTYQQWKAVQNGSYIRLQNVGNGKYLRYFYNRLSMDTANNASSVSFGNNKSLYVGSRFIVLGANGVSQTQNTGDATALTLTVKNSTEDKPYYEATITNIKAQYILPETGGSGTYYLYIIGGLLITLSAVFLLCLYKKDRGRRRRGFG